MLIQIASGEAVSACCPRLPNCYAEASAGAYETYVVRTRSRVEGSGRTYAEEAKSSTVVEGKRHTGVLWGERPRLEKEVKLRNALRKTQTI